MTISTVESLNCALRNLSNVGVKPEYFSSVSNTSAVAAVNVDVDKFNEDYLGYINCNTLRAGYPESKRAGEALCQAYISKYD